MSKKITMSARPQTQEQWVKATPQAHIAKGPMKRLTIDVPEEIHKRLKLACVNKGKDMAEFLRGLIETNLDKV